MIPGTLVKGLLESCGAEPVVQGSFHAGQQAEAAESYKSSPPAAGTPDGARRVSGQRAHKQPSGQRVCLGRTEVDIAASQGTRNDKAWPLTCLQQCLSLTQAWPSRASL